MDYLLFLQDIRLALGPGVESAVTHFSDGVLTLCFVLPFLIYWGIDKELGTFSVNCYAAGFYMNGILKVTACVSRPWILDARIQPSDAAKVEATGYSFPSGHTTLGTATFGSIAVNTRRMWLRILCWVLIPLIMLARNYLGVHTAQDVLVGFASTLILVLAAVRVRDWIRAHDVHWGQLVIVVLVLGVIAIAYTSLKSYPVVEGVDVTKMQHDTFRAIYEWIGCVIGFWLESRFVRFSTEGKDRKVRILRMVLGFVILFLAVKRLAPAIGVAGYAVATFILTFVVPLLFTCIERMIARKEV